MTVTKRIFTIAILTILPLMQMMAQSIEGKWKMSPEALEAMEIGDDNATGDIILNFGQTDVTLLFQVNYSDDEVGTIGFEMSMPGTYKMVDNNVIENTFNEEAADAQINKLELSSEIKKAMDASAEVKSMFINALTSELNKNKPQMIEGLKMIGKSLAKTNIVKNDGTTLTLSFDDKTIDMIKVVEE